MNNAFLAVCSDSNLSWEVNCCSECQRACFINQLLLVN